MLRVFSHLRSILPGVTRYSPTTLTIACGTGGFRGPAEPARLAPLRLGRWVRALCRRPGGVRGVRVVSLCVCVSPAAGQFMRRGEGSRALGIAWRAAERRGVRG